MWSIIKDVINPKRKHMVNSKFKLNDCTTTDNKNLINNRFNESLQWRHNESDGFSNRQPHHCLLNRLFGRTSKKTSKIRVTGLCAGNSPETGEFPAQMASNAENVSIWWRHHGIERRNKTPEELMKSRIINSLYLENVSESEIHNLISLKK